MTVAAVFALVAVALCVVAPSYLRLTADPRVHPRLALWAWLTALTVAPLTALAAGVLLLLPHPGVFDGALGLARLCLAAVREGDDLPWLLVGRVAIGLGLITVVAHAAVVVSRDGLRARRSRHTRLAGLAPLAERDGDLWWLPLDTATAFTVGGGQRGVIVASTGLAALGPSTRDAVLAHEQAHRRGHHHLAVVLARGLARALPRVPLCREAPAAIGVLCELAADAEAVRRCGPDAVATALDALAADRTPADVVAFGAHARARRAWLARHRRPGLRGSGPGSRAVAAALAVLPALGPAVGAAALVLATCVT